MGAIIVVISNVGLCELSYYLYHYFSVDFKCTVCNKTFTNKGNLKRHERGMHSDAVFQCQECTKFFKRRDMLQRHAKTHALSERLPCPSCPRSFLAKRNLDIHRRCDHPVSLRAEYTCSLCHEMFSQHRDYIEHRDSAHIGNQQACEQPCAQPQQPEGTYPCDHCDFSCHDRATFIKHIGARQGQVGFGELQPWVNELGVEDAALKELYLRHWHEITAPDVISAVSY